MKQKLTKALFATVFLLAAAPALLTTLVSTDSLVSSNLVPAAYSTNPADDYKGPLCSNGAGTYCCKDSGTTSCAAGSKCSDCKATNAE